MWQAKAKLQPLGAEQISYPIVVGRKHLHAGSLQRAEHGIGKRARQRTLNERIAKDLNAPYERNARRKLRGQTKARSRKHGQILGHRGRRCPPGQARATPVNPTLFHPHEVRSTQCKGDR